VLISAQCNAFWRLLLATKSLSNYVGSPFSQEAFRGPFMVRGGEGLSEDTGDKELKFASIEVVRDF
jgi:hypothetical protein